MFNINLYVESNSKGYQCKQMSHQKMNQNAKSFMLIAIKYMNPLFQKSVKWQFSHFEKTKKPPPLSIDCIIHIILDPKLNSLEGPNRYGFLR